MFYLVECHPQQEETLKQTTTMQEKKILKISNDIFFEQVLLYLKENKKIKMVVQGNSMFPFLRNGDEVLLAPTQPDFLKSGSIVLAKTEIGIVLHRIININENFVTLAGDGNISQIEHTNVKDIYGILEKICRKDKCWVVSSCLQNFLWKMWHLLRPIRNILMPLLKRLTNYKQKQSIQYENKR